MARQIRAITRYKMDNTSFGAFMLSDQIWDPVKDISQEVKDNAERMARAEAFDTGAYASSFGINKTTETINGNPRVVGEVYNDDPAAAAVEFGQRRRNQKKAAMGRRILRRAAAPFDTPKRRGRR